MLAGLDLPQIEEITHGGVTVLLMLGLAFVWRAWQAERAANSAYQREFLTHVAERGGRRSREGAQR